MTKGVNIDVESRDVVLGVLAAQAPVLFPQLLVAGGLLGFGFLLLLNQPTKEEVYRQSLRDQCVAQKLRDFRLYTYETKRLCNAHVATLYKGNMK